MIRFAEVAQPWRVAREDGVALLLQWGSSRTLADGPYVDITRQFITPGADGAIIQLSLTFTFEPRSVLDALESGNQWSFGHSPRDFRALVEQQPAYLGTADALIVDRHLTLDRV